MQQQWSPLSPGQWSPKGEMDARYLLNRKYMVFLEPDRMLLHHEMLAGLIRRSKTDPNDYGGWESSCCQLKGHFLGHYLSACAMAWAYHADATLKGRGEEIVARLRQCQLENGDGWCFSVPQAYMSWLERGKPVWAPQYTVHKTLMGLLDMASLADCAQALEVVRGAAEWFLRWIDGKSRAQADDILDVETGGMLEAWVDLYALTGEKRYLPLIDFYRRPRVFDALESDPLTMMHANTTIPEALGYARAYEVLGDEKDMATVERYWQVAIEERGTFVTGGQTYNEVWTPKRKQAAYLGRDNQEHCVMYNLIRLADFLWRHTGNARYLDYIERAYVNGILAQQHPDTGMVAYYLPMTTGAKAKWGSRTEDFWCCHGTLVQVHECEGRFMAYRSGSRVLIPQYREGMLTLDEGTITLCEKKIETHYAPLRANSGCSFDESGALERRYTLCCRLTRPIDLTLRVPEWTSNATIDGKAASDKLVELRVEGDCDIDVRFPMTPSVQTLPDDPQIGAFVIGEDVLVGLTDDATLRLLPQEAARRVERANPGTMRCESALYRLNDGTRSVELIPLKELRDEAYTLYFTFNEGK